MRLLLPPLALATTLVLPAIAQASPFPVPSSAHGFLGFSAEPPADVEADDTEAEPADDHIPTGDRDAIDPTTDDPTEGEYVDDDDDDLDLPSKPAKKGDFNANAIGISGGIHLVPSYFLNAALASYANSVCRNEVGSWGERNGLVKVDGCNFYVNGGYTRRVSRAFDVNIAVGYLHIRPPDSLWIDKDEWKRDSCTTDTGSGTTCNLGAADYTQIDLRMFTTEVNFVGRGTLYRNADVEVQLGAGGGIGMGVLIGAGVSRTPLGPNPGSPGDPNSCQTLADTADFRKCTPRYYDDTGIDQSGDGNKMDVSREEVDMGAPLPNGTTSTGNSFAQCSRDKCSGSDLRAFGATETGGTWPVYPMVNIFGSFRVIVKDTFGINLEGGFKNGFFFGGGIHYFFGGGGKNR
jgi:hypothetical protein